MTSKKKVSFCAAICFVAISLSILINPTYSRYVLKSAGEILHTVITAHPLTVTFMNGEKIVHTIEVGYGNPVTIDQTDSLGAAKPQDDAVFDGWMNASGAKPESIAVKRNVVLNAKWKIPDKYNLYYVDTEGHIVLQKEFSENTPQVTITQDEAGVLSNAATDAGQKLTTEINNVMTVTATWENYATVGTHTMPEVADVTVNLKLSFGVADSNASIHLEPVEDSDKDGDGFPDEYIFTGAKQDSSNINVVIPDSILGGKIVEIADKSFYGFSGLHAVRIPKSVTAIGAKAFSDKGANSSGETITIYYEGSYEEWNEISKAVGWDTGLGNSTNIFFLNGGDKVDSSQGYIDRTGSGYFFGNSYKWEYKEELDASFNSTYQADCNCEVDGCPKSPRPDAIYWPAT